ncbi:MAG: branched-chain amino acid transporter AzlD [Lachnospiraceae bacterium]|nr:branched-chain amino acid transporter AzlD [Lachnospiraceae bacterium]
MLDIHSVLIVGVASAVTILLRFLPFFIFGEKKTPEFLDYLGKFLQYAIMAMLVVYCLKGVTFASAVSWIPSAVGVIVVAALHVWKRNTLLSIVGGTICYMVMVQGIF